MTALPQHLQHVIDEVCARGCTAVNAFIDEVEAGTPPIEIRSIPSAEQDEVLAELKDIMSVYQRDC